MKIDWERIITPSAWTQGGITDWDWDAEVNRLLDDNQLYLCRYRYSDTICEFTAYLGPHYIWVGNYPFSYGSQYSSGMSARNSKLPSVRTRKRLKKAIRSETKAREWHGYSKY